MSALASIRAALETQLATITPAIDTAYENVPYVPVTGTPYQQAFLLPATPLNIEIGPGYFEGGLFQVNLYYPKDAGSGAATARAGLIRAAFPYGATLTAGGISVNIINTTEIGPARPDDATYMVPVKVRWRARIGS